MTKGTQHAATPMTLRLKLDLFHDVATRRGWKSNAAIARALGVPRTQVTRILNGEQVPTAEFIAGFLTAVPEAGFRRSFDPVPVTDTTKEATT